MTALLDNVCSISVHNYVDYLVVINFCKYYRTICYVSIICLMASGAYYAESHAGIDRSFAKTVLLLFIEIQINNVLVLYEDI